MLELLRTKISLPPMRPHQIKRTRLLQRIDEGVLRALTLVVAPAGFGKTTLVAAWSQRTPIPATWLSLDDSDQNSERFLTYLVLTLQQISPKIGQTALALLHSGQSVTKEGVLYSLIEDLINVSNDFVIILDDYHLAESKKINQTLQFLLEHRPNNFHIILISRTTPSFSLTRLRALDQVIDITADDLRFTDEETLTFLDESMGLKLNPPDLERLKQSTEGWAVGLQLAALAFTRQTTEWQIPAGKAHIFDYLAQEVLRREPQHIQDFLLRVSLFDRFCASLCETLLDEEPHIDQSAGELLNHVERANLFIFPLDAEGTWYRLHALFADFLRQRISQQNPQKSFALYQQASQWFEAQGLINEAVHYAIRAQDFERAADLLANHYRAIIQNSQQVTLLEWLSEIPMNQMDKRPILWLIKGWASVVALDTSQARECARRFEKFMPPTKMATKLKAELKALRILADILEGKSSSTEEISEAFILLSEQDDFLHLLLYLNLGMMSIVNGETQQAIEAFSQILTLTQAFENPLITTMTSTHKAETHTMRGEFDQAEEIFHQTFRYIKENLGEKSFLLALPMIGYAELLREQNRFDEAQQYAEQGLAYSKLWQPTTSLDARIVLARIQAAQENWEQAYEHLENAIQTAKSSDTILDDLLAAIQLVRLHLLQGDAIQAVYWSKFYHIETRTAQTAYYLQELAQMVQMRLQVSSTKHDPQGAGQIARELIPLIEKARARGGKTATIEALILQAYARHQAKEFTKAVQALDQALTLGATSGYVRIFADEGLYLRQLFEHYRKQLVDHGPYLKMLLSIMGKPEPDILEAASSPKDLIPLTRRELEVLQHIARGQSNQEIADELVLALNTVKKHVANILGKLGVSNRTQAVMVAREKDWLNEK